MNIEDRIIAILGVALAAWVFFIMFIAGPLQLYRDSQCTTKCAAHGQICADKALFSDAAVCASPGESNVNAHVHMENE
jgi:hypothetical protein